MKVVLTTKYTEGGMQMRHVFDELEAQGLKPKMLFKKDHDEISFEVPTVEPQEWISVKEHGKPKEAGVYYVTVQKENGDRNVIRDHFYGGNSTYFWEELTYELIGAKYIAWQPITEPSPYKGE